MKEPRKLMGTTEVGALFGVPGSAVRTWRERHTTPAADVAIGDENTKLVHGWLPDRADEWREWKQDGRQGDVREPQHLLGVSQIGALFGVKGTTVTIWLSRYADTHPCPVADFEVGEAKPVQGWLPSRELEWREWHQTRPQASAQRATTEAQVQKLEQRAAAARAELRKAKAALRASGGR